MNILVIHGYLLTGTGSNLYVENLAREFCKMGHSVFLVCQDYFPENIDYIEDVFGFDYNKKNPLLLSHKNTGFPGKCKFLRPDIGELLPVYVLDHYPGFDVKIFPNCTNREIQNYIDRNKKALSWIMNRFSIDIIQTNHLIMFPFIISRVLKSRVVKAKNYITAHGSSLNFSIKKDKRFIHHAREGLLAADGVFVDSAHARNELMHFAQQNNMNFIKNRTSIIPAGVDISRFNLSFSTKITGFKSFIRVLESADDQKRGRSKDKSARILKANIPETENGIAKFIEEVRSSYDYRYPDQDILDKIKKLHKSDGELVIFVGKYLWTKGIYLILLAIPLILEKYPRTKFVFVGFGPFREIAELIINFFSKNKIILLQTLLKTKLFFIDQNLTQGLPFFEDSLKKHSKKIQKSLNLVKNKIIDSIVFTGILDHEKLRYLLPMADILIAPSVFPEAFGMVAIEALACGVYPIITYQSAFKEIVEEIKTHLGNDLLIIEKVYPTEDAFIKINNNVDKYFKFKQELVKSNSLNQFKKKLRNIIVKKYSWEAIASLYIDYYKT